MAKSQIVAIQDMTDASWKMLQASSETYADALLRYYEDFEKRVIADLSLIHSEAANQGTASYSDFLQTQGHLKTLGALQNQLQDLNKNVNSVLYDSLVQQYKDAYNHSAWVLDETTPPNVDINYTMPPEDALRQFVSEPWNGAMFSQRIGEINNAMAQDIQQAVTQAMLSGDSVSELGKRISDVIGDADSDYMYRAKVIAKTEMARMSDLAHEKFYDSNADLVDDWYWVSRSVMSPRLCDDCAERSGKGYEEVKLIAAGQDHDELDPPIHPNCACVWMARPKKWKDLLSPELSKGLSDKPWYQMAYEDNGVQNQNPMEYKDWASQYLDGEEV